MRSPPPELTADHLTAVLADGWDVRATSLAYLPEGGGSHHWALGDPAAGRRFITVDDLTAKPWMNHDGNGAYVGLRSALVTAATLRDQSGLRFVVAPLADRHGEPLRRIGARYTVSVFPFVAGAAFPFGPYTDSRVRERVIGLIAELHRATRPCAGSHRVITSASAAERSLRASCCGRTRHGPAVSSPRMHALRSGPRSQDLPGCWPPSTGWPPLPARSGRPAR